jgi:hypothetical protein
VAAGVLAAALAGGIAHGQAAAGRDFCADRPGKATPACILDRGHLQVETGLADDAVEQGPDALLLGQTELRFGLSRRTELEAAWTPLSLERGADDHRTGTGDLTLGFRSALTDPDGPGAAISWQALVTTPTATNGQGAGGWEATARLPVSADLAHGFSLGVTPEADLRRDDDGHGAHLAFSGAAAISHDLAGLSVAAELWAERDEDPADHITRASFDLSAAWMLGKTLQLDAGANAGLNHATPNLEVYVGVAKRF